MSAKLIYATSYKCADMLYATGFFAADPFIYFSVGTEKGIIVSALEHSRAVKEVNSEIKVYEISDISGPKSNELNVHDIILKLNDMFPDTEWQVPPDFPFSLAKKLLDNKMNVYSNEKCFLPKREIKTQKEVRALKNGLEVAEKAMHRAFDIISSSKVDNQGFLLFDGKKVTSEMVRKEIDLVIFKNGGLAENTIVAGGKYGSEPHNTGHGPLLAGEPIVVDIFPRILTPEDKTIAPGYWGDITRTFVKGKASDIVKRAYNAVKMARDGSQNMIKEGVNGNQVHKFAQEVLIQHGFETGKKNSINYGFFHGLGHGVGLEVHETPSLSLRNEKPLKAGNVITVEPGLYYPEWGGVRLENMVEVHKLGCNILNRFPDILEIE